MQKPRKRTLRGTKYDALSHGYRILKSPLAQTFSAAAEHFDKIDPPIDPANTSIEPNKDKRRP